MAWAPCWLESWLVSHEKGKRHVEFREQFVTIEELHCVSGTTRAHSPTATLKPNATAR